MSQLGMLIIVSAPSGTGKNAVIRELTKKDSNIFYSVSATTRNPRNKEENGVNYFFLSREKFENMIINKQLIEWDEYVNNYYGTPKKFIEDMTKKGNDVILEITVEGAVNVKEIWPEAVMIFLLPPSMEELRNRITNRNTECIESINKRMISAESELKYVNDYEYVVINDDLAYAVNQIEEIIHAERLKTIRNKNIVNKLVRRKK
ncbi:MAG: guanylate kinase [Clostridiales bacterium]|nr:guanylate kinase [Clostridiales bacterium]